ncbi:hypothetical protein D3C85_1465630 [compost metagenome]
MPIVRNTAVPNASNRAVAIRVPFSVRASQKKPEVTKGTPLLSTQRTVNRLSVCVGAKFLPRGMRVNDFPSLPGSLRVGMLRFAFVIYDFTSFSLSAYSRCRRRHAR